PLVQPDPFDERGPRVDEGDPQVRAGRQAVGGDDAGVPAADDDDVCRGCHRSSLLRCLVMRLPTRHRWAEVCDRTPVARAYGDATSPWLAAKCAPHSSIAATTGARLAPSGVSEYSTRGGTSGWTVRSTIPSSSSSRS